MTTPLPLELIDSVQHESADLSLLCFNTTMSINTAMMPSTVYNPYFKTFDATAIVDIDAANFRQMFGFGIDSILGDSLSVLNDVTIQHTRFYIYDSKIDIGIPLIGDTAIVTTGRQEVSELGTNTVDELLKYDFVRYLSHLLFNNPSASGLFLNELTIVDSVATAVNAGITANLATLHNISTNGGGTGVNTSQYITDPNGNYMVDLGTDEAKLHNICCELFKQLLTKDPKRFHDINKLKINLTDNVDVKPVDNQYHCRIPLFAGDIIIIQMTLKPSNNQDTFGLTYLNDESKFDPMDNTHLCPHTYLIKMRLRNMAEFNAAKLTLANAINIFDAVMRNPVRTQSQVNTAQINVYTAEIAVTTAGLP